MSAARTPGARRRAARRTPRPVVAGINVQPLEPRVLFAGFSAGFYNSAYWGAVDRIYPADPNPADAATDAGSIRLNDTTAPSPADPLGIAARDPDAVQVIDTGFFSYNSVPQPPPPSITGLFSTIFTARVTVPSDGDAVPDEELSIAFRGGGDPGRARLHRRPARLDRCDRHHQLRPAAPLPRGPVA